MCIQTCRNIFSIFLVSAFLLTVIGCGGGETGDSASNGTSTVVSNASSGNSSTDTGSSNSTTNTGSNSTTYGAAQLSWTPPTSNTDDTQLTIAGYKIYYGTAPGVYSKVVNVSSGLTEYVIDNLASDTYYFVITVYDNQLVESDYSNEVTKSI